MGLYAQVHFSLVTRSLTHPRKVEGFMVLKLTVALREHRATSSQSFKGKRFEKLSECRWACGSLVTTHLRREPGHRASKRCRFIWDPMNRKFSLDRASHTQVEATALTTLLCCIKLRSCEERHKGDSKRAAKKQGLHISNTQRRFERPDATVRPLENVRPEEQPQGLGLK